MVTGGLGFIGSNVAHRLVQAGATVRVIDALVPEHGGDVRNVDGLDLDVVVAPIGDERTAPAMRAADFVFNLAGQVSHTASMRDPAADLHWNAVTHARLLELARAECPRARIVHTSTRQVYGRALRAPVDEAHPTHPVDVNGASKLAGEQLHLVYAQAYGMPITSLRLTNVYGPRQRLSSNDLGFLPVFIRMALRGETIELFGDGSQRRDCLFIDDVVDAVLAATDERVIGRVLNVGNDLDHSLADIARVIIEATGGASEVRCREWPAENRRIDIGSFRSDNRAIAAAIGWHPVTSLDDGMRRTADFYRAHPWYLS